MMSGKKLTIIFKGENGSTQSRGLHKLNPASHSTQGQHQKNLSLINIRKQSSILTSYLANNKGKTAALCDNPYVTNLPR